MAIRFIRAPNEQSGFRSEAMKLCPECQFIYEDDQSLCDMDGVELVYDPGPSAGQDLADFEATVFSCSPEIHDTAEIPATVPEIRDTLEIPVIVPSAHPVSQSPTSHFRRNAVAALAAMVLVALLCVVYYARTRPARAGNSNQASNQTSVPTADQLTQIAALTQAAFDLVTAPDDPAVTTSDQSAESTNLTTSSSPSLSPDGLQGRGRLTNPVSARGSAGTRSQVILWLVNGSSIKADEAWQKREGIWYRQGGMVTFIKRGQVRSIQRPQTAGPLTKSVAIKVEEQSRKPELIAQNHTVANAITQNQRPTSLEANPGAPDRKRENTVAQHRPVANPELTDAKKDSKVSSFLKKTGRILKRPFQF